MPNKNKENIGLIIYPGALVEPEAYSYYASELATAGYLVTTLKVNLNLSIFDSNKAGEVMSEFPNIERWYLVGHSMGGVSAAMFTKNNYKDKDIEGLILLASYTNKNNDLSQIADLSVLSIYAELDGLATIEDILSNKKYLPQNTTFHLIKGGNHAQFGLYGDQSGDLPAILSPIDQQNEIIKTTLKFLNSNSR
ncbi:MAG: hypothetical protein ATN31_08060 [Candidatus Epulonipiscioides saccharophilum]|nr:MAG: hypothetical protein ATN31_08060 [Epulopiscium sp. AS2M-Bin001]